MPQSAVSWWQKVVHKRREILLQNLQYCKLRLGWIATSSLMPFLRPRWVHCHRAHVHFPGRRSSCPSHERWTTVLQAASPHGPGAPAAHCPCPWRRPINPAPSRAPDLSHRRGETGHYASQFASLPVRHAQITLSCQFLFISAVSLWAERYLRSKCSHWHPHLPSTPLKIISIPSATRGGTHESATYEILSVLIVGTNIIGARSNVFIFLFFLLLLYLRKTNSSNIYVPHSHLKKLFYRYQILKIWFMNSCF